MGAVIQTHVLCKIIHLSNPALRIPDGNCVLAAESAVFLQHHTAHISTGLSEWALYNKCILTRGQQDHGSTSEAASDSLFRL